MKAAAAVLAGAVLVGAAPRSAAQVAPRWAALENVRLDGWVDEALALGGSCRSALAVQDLRREHDAASFAAFAFGQTLPHGHRRSDSTAVKTALANASACRIELFESRAEMLVLAFDRRIAAILVWFDAGHPSALTADSVRARTRDAWGRPTHPAPRLDTWWGRRHRAYLLVLEAPDGGRYPQLIMVSLPACTAFDRRVHRAGARGAAAAC